MSYEQQLIEAHKERRARLWAPRPRGRPPLIRYPEISHTIICWPSCEGPWIVESQPVVPKPLRWRGIAENVAAKHGLTMAEMTSKRRQRKYVLARREAFWRLWHETNMSTPQIGRLMGNWDHTTVLHAVRMYEQDLLREAGQ